jgi:hypothetical protein
MTGLLGGDLALLDPGDALGPPHRISQLRIVVGRVRYGGPAGLLQGGGHSDVDPAGSKWAGAGIYHYPATTGGPRGRARRPSSSGTGGQRRPVCDTVTRTTHVGLS